MTEYADWIIYYADGSSYSSLDGAPEDAPRLYVECIAVAHISCGNYVLAEQNFYCWHTDEEPPQWVPHDTPGLWQYLAAPGAIKIVLQGYWIDRRRYAQIRTDAQRDPRLPPVTAGPPRQPEGELQ